MIYFRYISMEIKRAMEYRSTFILTALGQFGMSLLSFLGISLLFAQFDNIQGWTFGEVALCYAVTNIAFALAECIGRGFDSFANQIRRGEFDRVMLRPRPTLLQVLGGSFEIGRLGRVIQGVMVLAVALPGLSMDAGKAFLICLMVLSGTVIFTGVFILGAVVCFFTIEGLEWINVFTYGGREAAGYPLSIYGKWMARLFTFVLPFGCFNYLPLTYIVGRAQGREWLYAASPILGMLFIVPCLVIWNWGVKHYLSTGS